jgi:hypothetical protein
VGLIAALFLSLEIYYFTNSRIFVGSVASAALGGLAVLGALYYHRTGSRKLLVLTGVVFSFSLFVKPLSLFAGFLLLWAVIARRWRETSDVSADRWSRFQSFPWRGLFADCLYLAMGILALPLLSIILYDEGAIVSRMIDCRFATKVSSSRGGVYLARLLIDYVRVNLPLFVLAALGTIVAIRRRDGSALWVITWLGLSISLMLIWRAHSHNLVVLSLPLALLAAYPLGGLDDIRAAGRLRLRRWTSVLVILGLGYWLGTLILGWRSYFSVAPRGLDRPDDADRWAAVSLLQRVTTQEQFVVSDDLSIPFETRRMVMPQLADVSSESIGCGLVTQQTVMQAADRDGSAFIFWTNRFLDEFPILPFWTPVAYGGRTQFDEEHIVFYEKQPPQIAHPLSVTFGKVIALEGYKLSADAPSQLTLFWRKLSADAVDYKITLRLLNSDGGVVAQYDDQPYSGFFPITAWPVGVLLPEELTLPSTDDLPPGEYSLVIGLYDPQTLELLAIEGATGENYDLALIEMLRLGEY